MNTELLEALTILEEEKDISRDTLMDAIENSLINACKNHFGKADNIKVIMDKETCDYTLIQEKTVVEDRCRRSRGQSRTDQSCRCEDDRSFL